MKNNQNIYFVLGAIYKARTSDNGERGVPKEYGLYKMNDFRIQKANSRAGDQNFLIWRERNL